MVKTVFKLIKTVLEEHCLKFVPGLFMFFFAMFLPDEDFVQ